MTAKYDFALLCWRLGFGLMMLIGHGIGKVDKVVKGDLSKFADPIGIGPQASLLLATFAEVICAIMIIIGWKTRFATLAMVVTMVIAAFVAHGSDPFFIERIKVPMTEYTVLLKPSKEPALLYLLGFFPLLFCGAGAFSLDNGKTGEKKSSAD